MAYFVVHDWMAKELHLKGLQKELYAIIYGFSQDGESEFYGSLSYLAELTGNTTRGVQKALTELVNANLLSATKIEGKPTRYKVNPRTEFTPTHELSSPNNKDNNKEVISKDITKKNLYQQCADIITNTVTDKDVTEKLFVYLSLRIKEPLSAKAWQTIIDKLYEVADSKDMALKIIQQSIDKCYKSFYPVTLQKKDSGGARDTSTLAEDYITQAYHQWAESGKFFGEKEEFKNMIERGEIVL